MSRQAISVDGISRAILILRDLRVILDADLAALYGVTTKRLNEQVKRNAARFPQDFVFRLSAQETETLNRSHFATGSQKHRDPRFPPFAFTEHGAIMAANVLNSPRAVEMSIYVVRAFVQLREWISSNKELGRRLDALEARIEKKLTSHDEAIAAMRVIGARRVNVLPERVERVVDARVRAACSSDRGSARSSP